MALQQSYEILGRNRQRNSFNLEQLRVFCSEHSDQLLLYPPKAGTMAVVEQKTNMPSAQFCERLLGAQRVFLVPGESMRISNRGNLRRTNAVAL